MMMHDFGATLKSRNVTHSEEDKKPLEGSVHKKNGMEGWDKIGIKLRVQTLNTNTTAS